MSVSAIYGSKMVVFPNSSSLTASGFGATKASPRVGGGLVIESSSRSQKKATAHHMKTRPHKTQPWDIRRKPTVYPPLPPLPADWTFAASDIVDTALPSPLPPQPE